MEVPEGWTKVDNLKDVISVIESGKRPKGGVSGISEGIPSLGGEHLTYDGNFDFTKIKYVPNDFFENMKKGIIHEHDILMVKDGATTGKTSFVDETFQHAKACVNEHVFIIRPNHLILSKFLYYFLRSSIVQNHISKKTNGIIGGINLNFTENLPIIFPNEIVIQEQIVNKLDYTLKNIDEKKKQILDLKKKTFSLFLRKHQKNFGTDNLSRLLFSHKLDHIFEKESELKSKSTPLLELLLEPLRSGKSSPPTKTGIPILKLTAVTFKNFTSENIKFCNLSEKDVENVWVKKNDILIERSNSSEYVGISAIYEGDDSKFIYPDLMIRIRVNSQIILPQFLAYYLASSKVRAYFRKNAKGTSNTMVKINQSIIGKLMVPLPSIEKQKEIISEIDLFQNNMNNVGDEMILLKNLQDELLKYLDHIPNQILNEAFSGRLVN